MKSEVRKLSESFINGDTTNTIVLIVLHWVAKLITPNFEI